MLFPSLIKGFCGQFPTGSLPDSFGTLLEAQSGTLFHAVPTMPLGKPFLVRMGNTMAPKRKRTNATHNGITCNLFFLAHAHVHAKKKTKHCKNFIKGQKIILGI